MNVISFLKRRNIINKISDQKKILQAIKDGKGVYVGFDPSFKSLHLGNYIMINLLNIFNKFNIKTYALIGGATGRVGDPSGKKNERKLLDLNFIENNIICLKKQLCKLTNSEIINNYDFYKNLTIIDFLRDVGKKITLNYLLEKEIIKTRLENGISFAEVAYNLIQGNDFLKLYENNNVAIQIGGSDQWGNITTGLELIRKKYGENASACGITINLLLKSDGSKFGKSDKGAIYLDNQITSVFEIYQFFVNQDDQDLKKLFMFFTILDIEQIDEILYEHEKNKSLRYGQKKIAEIVITKIHGYEAYKQCLKIANALFKNEFNSLTLSELDLCFKQFISFSIDKETKLYDFLIEHKIIKSKRIFRELIATNSLFVNQEKIENYEFSLTKKNSYFNKYTVVKKGKKNYYIIIWKNKG